MNVSTKALYAAQAILDPAQRLGGGPILVTDTSRRQEVSDRYLALILTHLKIREGSTAPVECVDDAQICSLESITLQDLLERQRGTSNSHRSMLNDKDS